MVTCRISLGRRAALAAMIAGACHAGIAQTDGGSIAPGARLRVAMIGANPVLVTQSPDGSRSGVSFDLGNYIAGKIGARLVPVIYESPAAFGVGMRQPDWDIAIGPRATAAATGLRTSADFMFVD